MKHFRLLGIVMFILLGQPILVSCGSNNDDEEVQDETSPATIDYLCSTLLWVYVPDRGLKDGEVYESFFFGKIGDNLMCTIIKYKEGSDESSRKMFNFTYSAPTLYLREREDITGNDVPGGETRTLTVYKLTRPRYANYSANWLQIDGKPYSSSIGGGINLK